VLLVYATFIIGNVASGKELAGKSDIVMLALTTSQVVELVVYAEDGVLAGMTTVTAMSQAFAVAKAAVDAGLGQKDVPVIFDYFNTKFEK
jgi:3-hydroxyisobutyrate dehydrogenase-like beta-hydroxyacid dehydrogenase